jgi:hypothetical protein
MFGRFGKESTTPSSISKAIVSCSIRQSISVSVNSNGVPWLRLIDWNKTNVNKVSVNNYSPTNESYLQ